MSEKKYEEKLESVLEHFGGPRNTMVKYLEHLESMEMYDFCAIVRDRITMFDAGDENAFKGFID